jgi:flavin-dependent dehydrogenase
MDAPPIRIAGAGPAGLTAAIVLARHGRRVELFERHPRVGTRLEGSVHGVENWTSPEDFLDELRAMQIAPTFDCHPCRELVITDGRRTRVVSSAQPLFYFVLRGDAPGALERGLLDQARAAGVTVKLGQPAPPAVEIIASGGHSDHSFCVEAGFRFRTRAPDLALALVHPQAAPGGYAYLLIRGGVGSLCTVLFHRLRDARRALPEARRLIAQVARFDVIDPQPTGGYGSLCVPGAFSQARAKRIGEAAGLQDALWGFGIRKAMACGFLAASTELAGQSWDAAAARRFDPGMRASVVNRLLWEVSAWRGFSLFVSRMQRAADPRSALAAVHGEHWLHRLLYPLARARLEKRRSPPA